MFLGYCLQKREQPFLGNAKIEKNDELSAVNKVFQALEIYAADPLKKGHPVDALLEEAQARGINGENTAKEVYFLKKMGKTLDAFYPDLSR